MKERLEYIFFQALLLSILFIATGCGMFRGKRHNVAILLVDTLRADHLGCYGYEKETSPHLDEFSRRAVLFTDVTSQAPWTNPSVVSLMTSLYPSAHHITTLRDGKKLRVLDGEIETLAEVLKENGYRTAAFVANPWLPPECGLAVGFDVYRNLPMKASAELLNELAMEWISGSGDGPFFLYVHYMDVHGPYDPPPPYDTLFTAGLSGGRRIEPDEFERMPEYLRIDGLETLEEYTARYDGGIRFWDEAFSAFLRRLSEEGLLENSHVIVTADHGEEFLDHGGFNHGHTLYAEQTRVPLVWKLPADEGLVSRIGAPVEIVDVMPTLLSLLGIEKPESLQGDDLSSLMEGAPFDEPVFSEAVVSFGGGPPKRGRSKSVRVGRIKAIVNVDTGRVELYDLASDPHELSPIEEGMENERKFLLTVLEEWISWNARVGVDYRAGEHTLREELRERLEALGYIGE